VGSDADISVVSVVRAGAVVLLMLLASGGAGCASVNNGKPNDGALGFAVPSPSVGDDLTYDVSGVRGGGLQRFTWLSDDVGPGLNGTWIPLNRILRETRTDSSSSRDGSQTTTWTQGAEGFVAGTGIPVSRMFWDNSTSTDTNRVDRIVGTSYRVDIEAMHRGDLTCGVRNAFQGKDIEWGKPILDDISCAQSLKPQSATWRWLLISVSGTAPHRTVMMEAHLVTDPASDNANERVEGNATFDEGVAYPTHLEIRQFDGSNARIELASFTPGRGAVAADPSPILDAPKLQFAPRQPWGPDESGTQLAYPLSLAWSKANADPNDATLRDFLAAHPDAYVGRASYQEYADYRGDLYRTWWMTVTDGPDKLVVGEQQDNQGAPGGPPLATIRYETRHDTSSSQDPGYFLEPSKQVSNLATARSLEDVWSFLAARHGIQGISNFLNFDLACYPREGSKEQCPRNGYFLAAGTDSMVTQLVGTDGIDLLPTAWSHSEVTFDAAGNPVEFYVRTA
jgi:hypothetical protein